MYYSIQDNNLLIAENKEALEKYYSNVFELPNDYENGKYSISSTEIEVETFDEQGESHIKTITVPCLVINTNYEAEQKEKEQQRISMLSLTGADVERGIYKAKGMDFEDIVALVTQLQPEGLDIKALKIELKANNFYRGNPYVDTVGTLLGFTKEQLDKFFEDGNYEHLLEVTDETV